MQDKTAILLCAISCISAIEIVALVKGVDGLILTAVISTIASLATAMLARIYYIKVMDKSINSSDRKIKKKIKRRRDVA